MNIVFRADATLQIGAGHVMRCLTLANALRNRGAHCLFVCREESGNLLGLIRQQGFNAVALPVGSGQGIDWHSDAEQTKVGAGETATDWIVVDHYALDASWERLLRPHCRKLMVIDDLADRPHDCDLLLDQNLGRTVAHYANLTPANCSTLFGPRYALLRPEFSHQRPYSLARREGSDLDSIIITMGGMDNDNATCKVLEALRNCSLPKRCTVKVVMGSKAPWIDQVRHTVETMPHNTEIAINPEGMAKLMADADLAIGASGSTSWERCCVGLPSVLIVTAANQEYIARQLAEFGAARIVRLESLASDMKEILNQLQADPTELRKMAKVAASITNGNGVDLVIRYLEAAG